MASRPRRCCEVRAAEEAFCAPARAQPAFPNSVREGARAFDARSRHMMPVLVARPHGRSCQLWIAQFCPLQLPLDLVACLVAPGGNPPPSTQNTPGPPLLPQQPARLPARLPAQLQLNYQLDYQRLVVTSQTYATKPQQHVHSHNHEDGSVAGPDAGGPAGGGPRQHSTTGRSVE